MDHSFPSHSRRKGNANEPSSFPSKESKTTSRGHRPCNEASDQNSSAVKQSTRSSNGEKLAVAKVAPVALEKDNQNQKGRVKGIKVFANPFIESYYPVLEDFYGEDSHGPLNTGNSSAKDKNSSKLNNPLKNQVITSLEGSDSHYNMSLKKKNVEISGKENKPVSLNSIGEIKNNVTRSVIESFASRTDKDTLLKSFIKGRSKAEEEQLHLHHHEHHHHYYFDRKKTSEKQSTETKQISINPNECLITASSKKLVKEKKRQKSEGREKNQTVKPKPTYIFECAERPDTCLPNINLYSTSGATFVQTSKEFGSIDIKRQDFLKNVLNNEAVTSLTSRLRASSSYDSFLFGKRSDLITTHNYSDTELSKYESEDTFNNTLGSQNEYFRVIRPKEFLKNSSKKSSKPDYSKLVESLRKLDDFMTPKIISDSNKPAKISYIRCECMTAENIASEKSSGLEKTQNKSDQATTETVEEEESSSNKSSANENGFNVVISNPNTDKGTLPFIAKGSKIELDEGKASLSTWTKKIRHELTEIKKELRYLEKKHLKKNRKSLTVILQSTNAESEDTNLHGISIYSSKTIIVGAQSIHSSKTEGRQIRDKDIEALFKSNKFSQGEKKISYHFLLPSNYYQKKVKNQDFKTVKSERRKIVTDRHGLSRQQSRGQIIFES